MDQQAFTELVRMLEGLPRRSGNPDLTVSAYELSVAGLSSQAVTEACQRFIDGVVEGQSLDFAPAPPRFAQEARKRQEYIDLKTRPRLPAPSYTPGPLAPFQVRQQKRLSENSHLPVLFENINSDQWRKMSLAREIPAGSKWVASLGIVYGPQVKQQEG